MPKQDTKNTKKKISFNLIDALIIVFILVALAAFIYTFLGNDAMELLSSKETIEYELSVDKEFNEGDVLYLEGSKKELGKVIKATKSGEATVLLVSAEAYTKDNDYFVKGQLIRKDAELDIKYGDGSVNGIIKRVK